MIILFQSVTTQCRRLFWHISYFKVRYKVILLWSMTGCYKSIIKCSILYYRRVRKLNSVTVVTKWDVTHGLVYFFFQLILSVKTNLLERFQTITRLWWAYIMTFKIVMSQVLIFLNCWYSSINNKPYWIGILKTILNVYDVVQ